MASFRDLIQEPTKSSTGSEEQIEKKQPDKQQILKGKFKIEKSNDDKMLAFGWASVAIRTSGEQVEDWQEDMIDPEELLFLQVPTIVSIATGNNWKLCHVYRSITKSYICNQNIFLKNFSTVSFFYSLY